MEAFQNGKFQAVRDERAMAIRKKQKEVLAAPAGIGSSDFGTFTIFNRRFGDFALRLHTFLKLFLGDGLKTTFFMALFACVLMAESAPPPPAAAAPANRGANPNVIPTFDQDFFNKVGPGNEAPVNDSKVTSDVRARIIKECESKKASGMSAFSQCYKERETAAASSREKEIDRINTQNNLPLQSAPKLIEDVQSKPMDDND